MKPCLLISDSICLHPGTGHAKDLLTNQVMQQVDVYIQVSAFVGARVCRLSSAPGYLLAAGLNDHRPEIDKMRAPQGLGASQVIIMLGYNDDAASYSNLILEEVIAFNNYLKQIEVTDLIVISPVTVLDPATEAQVMELRAGLEWVCGARNIAYVNGGSLLDQDPANFYQGGPHLDVPGHTQVATRLISAMQALGKW